MFVVKKYRIFVDGSSGTTGLRIADRLAARPEFELLTIAEAGKIALIIGAMLAGGIVISGVFSLAALNKFINMKSNKIYLY